VKGYRKNQLVANNIKKLKKVIEKTKYLKISGNR